MSVDVTFVSMKFPPPPAGNGDPRADKCLVDLRYEHLVKEGWQLRRYNDLGCHEVRAVPPDHQGMVTIGYDGTYADLWLAMHSMEFDWLMSQQANNRFKMAKARLAKKQKHQ